MRSLLTELRDQLVVVQSADVYAAPPQMINSSLRNANAQTVARVLAPFLFRQEPPSSSSSITSEQALQLLQCLVRSDAPRYLKPASRALRDESERLLQASTEAVHVSPAFLDVLVEQLQWMDATDVAENAAAVVRNGCRILPASFAETVCAKLVEGWRAARLEMSNIAKTQVGDDGWVKYVPILGSWCEAYDWSSKLVNAPELIEMLGDQKLEALKLELQFKKLKMEKEQEKTEKETELKLLPCYDGAPP